MQSTELILVVDDTPANLEVISEALTDTGFEVATAIDGERALRQVQHSSPDLILLDVLMPGIDGFETCKRLKSNPATRDIPVIFMTAISDTDSKVKGLSLGAVDYITKPFQEQEVLARVRTHLQLRTLTKSLEQQVLKRTAELSQALCNLKESQIQLVQREKMSTLGQLVAGVAHEINNPVGFITGNLRHAEEYIQHLMHLVDLYQQYYPEPVEAVQAAIESIDLVYLREDLPKLLKSMKQGTDRIREISISLRTFSRADSDRKVLFDIHEGIDSTILILKHRLKETEKRPAIQVIKQYGKLPLIECFPGQLNQVFMNLLANAIDALEEFNKGCCIEEIMAHPNQIVIQTVVTDHSHVQIRIRDNGTGMSDDVKSRLFDHLFTTKPVGQGTGLGLSIAHQIVVNKHRGTIEVNTAPGEGTEFIVSLPVVQNSEPELVSTVNSDGVMG
ncbi:MAG: response regulator [Cyanobacteria bacterium CRU_2_1]|nr:response regulator [Cyanobacteria bacterium RU_5_0]NJR61094.1 response regulator [Cyanobacteria bacterium CRU_2_1]